MSPVFCVVTTLKRTHLYKGVLGYFLEAIKRVTHPGNVRDMLDYYLNDNQNITIRFRVFV